MAAGSAYSNLIGVRSPLYYVYVVFHLAMLVWVIPQNIIDRRESFSKKTLVALSGVWPVILLNKISLDIDIIYDYGAVTLMRYSTLGESLYSGVACLQTDPFANFLLLLDQIIYEIFY